MNMHDIRENARKEANLLFSDMLKRTVRARNACYKKDGVYKTVKAFYYIVRRNNGGEYYQNLVKALTPEEFLEILYTGALTPRKEQK